MRKFVITCLLACLCLISWAGNIKKTSGDTSVLHQKEPVSVVFDFDKTTWEDDEDFKAWCGSSYSERIDLMENSFIRVFNEGTKGLQAVDDLDSHYQMVIHINNIERKQGLLFGLFYIRIYGTCEIVDTHTKAVVYSAKFAKLGGDANYVESQRLGNAFEALAKEMTSL